jgi:hypothetical protein
MQVLKSPHAHIRRPPPKTMKKIMQAVDEAKFLLGRFDTLAKRMIEIDSDLVKEGFSKDERKQVYLKYFGKVFSRSQIYRSMPIFLKRTYSKSSPESRMMRQSNFTLKDGGGIELSDNIKEIDVPKDLADYLFTEFAKKKRPLTLLVDINTMTAKGVGKRDNIERMFE